MTRSRHFVVTALALLIAGALSARAQEARPIATASAPTAALGFVGAWLMNVNPQGPGAPPPFLSVFTLFADGNGVITEGDEPVVTQGVWSQTGHRQAAFNGYQFEFSSDFTGTVHVTVTLELQGSNRMAGAFHADFLNADGSVAFSGGGPVTGTRILAIH